MKISKLHLTFFGLLTISAFEAQAQSVSQDPFAKPPEHDALGGFFGTGLHIETKKGSSDITAHISIGVEDKQTSGKTKALFSFSTSIDKDSDYTNFITDTGLPSDHSFGVKLSRSFSNFKMSNRFDEAAMRITKQAQKECKRLLPSRKKECSNISTKELLLTEFFPFTNSEERDILTNFRKANDSTRFNHYILSASGKIGKEQQNFLNKASFEKTNETKTPYSFGISVGVAPSKKAITYYAGLEHKIFYEAVDSRTLCNTETPTECFTSPYKPSEKTIQTPIYTAMRYQKSFKVGQKEFPIGFEAKLAYDLKSKVFGVEVPIYFTVNTDGDLIGGIRFRWDDDDDPDISVGVFVGKKFNLFK